MSSPYDSNEKVQMITAILNLCILQLLEEVWFHQSTPEYWFFDLHAIEVYVMIATHHGLNNHVAAVNHIMSTGIKFGGPFSQQCLLLLDLVQQASSLEHPQFAAFDAYLDKPHIKQELLRLSTALHKKEASRPDYDARMIAMHGARFEDPNHPYHESVEQYAKAVENHEIRRISDEISDRGLGWLAKKLAEEEEPEDGEVSEYEPEDVEMEDAEEGWASNEDVEMQ